MMLKLPATEGRTSLCDRLLLVLLVLTCMRVWVGDLMEFPQAVAQVPDSGLQRKQLLDEAEKSNKHLAEIAEILRNQPFKVTPVADSKGDPAGKSQGANRG